VAFHKVAVHDVFLIIEAFLLIEGIDLLLFLFVDLVNIKGVILCIFKDRKILVQIVDDTQIIIIPVNMEGLLLHRFN